VSLLFLSKQVKSDLTDVCNPQTAKFSEMVTLARDCDMDIVQLQQCIFTATTETADVAPRIV
jgi:hypothetical protein